MPSYAILSNPGHNRVYFQQSKALSLAELRLCLEHLGLTESEPEGAEIGGVYYVVFAASKPLSDEALMLLGRLSFVYAVFEAVGQGEETLLRPVLLPESLYLDSGISGILKYSGKTNELFTRLMINVAAFSCSFPNERLRLFDPVAGKGTTLFDALALGYDACGAELSDKAVSEGFTYLKKYLETERLKHTTGTEKINMQDKSLSARRYFADIARSKDEQKAGDTRRFELISGNSAYADRYFKKNSFHLIVGDLPYGVQHGNVGAAKTGGSLTRSPRELIAACAPGWHRVLKPGGAMALAWNSFVFSKEDFGELLVSLGFKVLTGGVYDQFEHRVDQAIRRDIIVAVK